MFPFYRISQVHTPAATVVSGLFWKKAITTKPSFIRRFRKWTHLLEYKNELWKFSFQSKQIKNFVKIIKVWLFQIRIGNSIYIELYNLLWSTQQSRTICLLSILVSLNVSIATNQYIKIHFACRHNYMPTNTICIWTTLSQISTTIIILTFIVNVLEISHTKCVWEKKRVRERTEEKEEAAKIYSVCCFASIDFYLILKR